MKGAVFLGAREVELREFPDPTPGDDEVVLEIKASGMCGSDLMVYRASPETVDTDDNGEYFIGGHEPCGVVVAKGVNVTDPVAAEGSRVMPHHYLGCGVCSECIAGWSQLCPEGSIGYGWNAHGGHARYMKTAARTLVALPEALSFSAGAAISCGTGTAYAALKRIGLTEGQTLAVFGQGPVGLSATLFGAVMGARVIAVDIEPKRLELARGFGADETLDATGDETVDAIKTLTAGHGADMSIDCSGSSQGRLQAVRSTRTWGTTCFVGEGNDVTLDVSQDLIRKQMTIIASWTFSSGGQAECAQFIADNDINVDELFTDRYTLDQAADAYRLFDSQTTGKGVFLPG